MTVLGTKDIRLFGRTSDGVDLPIKITSGGAVVVSGGASGVTDHGALTGLADDDHTQYLLTNGGRALTDNWFAGQFRISANEIISGAGFVSLGRVSGLTFQSTVATGTAPIVVASTTKVTNLNADLLDGINSSAFGLVANSLNQFGLTTSDDLSGIMTDETGNGALVFANTPVLTNPTLLAMGLISGLGFVSLGRISGTTLESTIATGTPPIVIASTTKVSNLNADLFDDLDSSAFAQNAFRTISVNGQSDVVADSPTDTLTLSGGTGISIITTAGTDTIVISGGGGTPGGSDTQLQYNNASAFGGTGGLTWDGTNLSLAGSQEFRVRNALNNRFYSSALNFLDIDSAITTNLRASGGIVVQVISGSATLSGGNSLLLRNSNATINSPASGTLALSGSSSTIIGVPGDISLGDATERDMYPQTDGKINLGNATNAFNKLYLENKAFQYNAVTTTGWGVPAIYATGRATAQTAAKASVATYTVGAADGSFIVSANVLVTTATTHNFTVTCAYTDEGNTARTLTFNFSSLAGVLATAIINTGGAVPYEGVPLHIRAKSGTAITVATTGTFTTVTYNVEASIIQVS